MIWNYYILYDINQYDRYQNDTKKTNYIVLSESDFTKKYGEKPWVLINNIMENFTSLDYKVNNPEGMSSYETFQLKLLHTQKPGLELDFTHLSSGERILMALIASIYKSTSDNYFPDLLLLDEVDASLHPSMMKNMLDAIDEIFLKQGIKVILVSHSPSTIALSPDESIFVMNKSGNDRIEKKSKQEALAILTEGFATLNDIEPNLSVQYNISQTELPVLFTEGITDKILIETAWNKLHPGITMPFYVQDCFDASFLRNLFARGNDSEDGIFTNYPDKKLIALFDFDQEGFNAWNKLSKSLTKCEETDPKNCLTQKSDHNNAFAMLLPVPNNVEIQSQVIKNGCETFKDKAILPIELLFYGFPDLDTSFGKETIQGGGHIIKFKGKKRDFAVKSKNLDAQYFKNFQPLFDKVQKIISTDNIETNAPISL